MNKRVRARFLIILGVTVLSIALFAGFPPTIAKMKQKVQLGLDLRGGTHLVLQVVTDDAIRAETDQAIESVRQQLQRENIIFRQLTRTQNNTFQAVGVDPAKDSDFRRILNERFTEWDLISTAGEVPNTTRSDSNLLRNRRIATNRSIRQSIRSAIESMQWVSVRPSFKSTAVPARTKSWFSSRVLMIPPGSRTSCSRRHCWS